MNFWQKLLEIFNSQMERPTSFGWFHLLFWGLTILFAVLLCVFHKKDNPDRVRKVVLSVAITVIILEIYKQINYSFSYENGISFDYQWYAFPWQFCSTPMYVGLLAGLFKKGKVHDALCAYLATYAMFAGLCVMIYPNDIYTTTIGINIQTSVCHGTMISIAIYLLYSGHVKLQHKTMLKAMSVFACAMGIAMLLNEIAHKSELEETFNMFYISPYFEGTLPVYSNVQAIVPFPFCTIIYFAVFSLAAYLILLISMGIQKIFRKFISKTSKISVTEITNTEMHETTNIL